jgi:hypothetical protein
MLPPPDISAVYVDEKTGKPSKDFFNWIKSLDGEVRKSSNPWVNVADFGADPTGNTDSLSAIQAAIDALPATGGDVIFPTGSYVISDTIVIGNGNSTTASTKNGICLRGQGLPGNALLGYDGNGVEIRTVSSFGSAIAIAVAGPIQGWGISNILLHCPDSSCPYGLIVFAGALGKCDNLSILDFGLCHLDLRAYDGVFFDAAGSSIHNTFTGLTIGVPDVDGSIGLQLEGGDGIPSIQCDSDYNTFINTFISLGANGANTNVGIRLDVCDSNMFYNTQISEGGNSTTNQGVLFNYSIDNSYPNSNKFYGIDCASYVQSGAPPFPNRPQVNEFYGIVQTNGNTPPLGIDNVSWVAGNDARFGYRYLVGDLPSPTNNATMRAFVSDATATTYHSVPIGGGGNFVPVFSDGTNWRIG